MLRNLFRITLALSLVTSAVSMQPLVANAGGTHTVTLNANGASGSTVVIRVATSSYKLPRVPFVRSGFSFGGWGKSPLGAKVYGDRATVPTTRNLTLFALWKEVPPIAPALVGHTIGKLLWHEEFRGGVGSAINPATWTARYCGQSAANGGGTCYNNEPQWYLPSEVALDGTAIGNARIVTKRVNSAPAGGICSASSCQFTSARFDTQGKVAFQYGYIEARIKMPAGGRNWPAYWMLGENITSVQWPRSGEIDIAEQGRDRATRNSGAIHYSTTQFGSTHQYDWGETYGVDFSADYHTYGLAWVPNKIELLVDGQVFRTFTSATARTTYWPFNNPFFLILNNATGDFGGSWTGWSQSEMLIDYVRAWKLDNQGTVYIR